MIEGLRQLDAGHRPVLLVKNSYNSGIDITRRLSRPGVDAIKLLESYCRPWSLACNREASGRAHTVPNEVAQQFAGASTSDPKLAFCESAACKVMKGGIFLMRYTNHLTNEGSL